MKKLFSKLMLVAMAAMTFTACEDVPEPYGKPYEKGGGNTEIEGAKGTGTKDDPFNAIAALNYGNSLASGEISSDYYYIKGKVVSVKEEFTTDYGNGTFYISEDGTSTNQFYAYRVLYLGNKKFVSSDKQIAAGDEVVICAKITNYNGTIETAQKEGFLYELNGENRGGEPAGGGDEGTPTGDGTLENPFNAAAAIAYCKQVGDAESPKDVYIKGKVVAITEQYGTQYGNATFTISDDGTDATTPFTVFRALYLGNKKYASGDLLNEKDEVIICGKVTCFMGNTPETVQGKAYLYSLNGKSEGGDTPQPGGEAKGTGTLEDPFNAVAANNEAAKLADKAVSDKAFYIKGKVSKIATDKNGNVQNFDFGTYGNATFYISDDGTEANQFYCYRVLFLENAKWEQGAGAVLKEGDEVIVCAKLTNYSGTYETAQNEGYLYSLNGTTKRGGDNPNPGSGGSGTLTDPYTAEAANAVGAALGEGNTSNDAYYIKGKVVSIPTDKNGNVQNYDNGTYGNATFYISADGTEANQFYCYRVLYLENAKWEQGAGPLLKVGDEVIVYSKITNYKGTSETVQNEGYLYSLNGTTKRGGDSPTTEGGSGTLADPYTAAAANALGTSLGEGNTSADAYYIKGKVVSIPTDKNGNVQNFDNGTYGNATFYISADGTEKDQFYVYRALYLEGAKWEQGAGPLLKVGDEVIVYSKITNYKGTSETVQNEGYLYSLNGTTKRGGGTDPGTDPNPGGDTTGDVYEVTMASFGLANAADANTLTSGDVTFTFAQEGGKNAPKFYEAAGGSVRMYAQNSLTITAKKAIAKVVITTTDPQNGTAYNGNPDLYGEAGGSKVTTTKDSDTQVTFSGFSNSTLKIVNAWDSNSGGTQLRVVKVAITYAK